MSETETTILLNIYERLGAIEAKLEDHKELKEDVRELKDFKARIGAYLLIGGSLVSGAIYLIWDGVKYFLAGKFFH